MMMKRMIDVVINLDSVILDENESLDDMIELLRTKFDIGYSPTYEVLYEEYFDD